MRPRGAKRHWAFSVPPEPPAVDQMRYLDPSESLESCKLRNVWLLDGGEDPDASPHKAAADSIARASADLGCAEAKLSVHCGEGFRSGAVRYSCDVEGCGKVAQYDCESSTLPY